MSTTKSTTVYCYDRFAPHKRIGAALMLVLGAGALWAVSSNANAAVARKVETLPRVVITGKSVKPAAQQVVQLPRVVIEGRRVQEPPLMALNRAGQDAKPYDFDAPGAGF